MIIRGLHKLRVSSKDNKNVIPDLIGLPGIIMIAWDFQKLQRIIQDYWEYKILNGLSAITLKNTRLIKIEIK